MESEKRAGKRVGIWIGAGLAIVVLFIVLFFFTPVGERLGLMTSRFGPYGYPGSTWVSDSQQITLHVSPEYDSRNGPYEAAEAYVTLDGEKIPVRILIERGRTVSICRRPAKSIDDYLLYGHLKKMTSKEVVIEVTEDHAFSGQYETITLKRVG